MRQTPDSSAAAPRRLFRRVSEDAGRKGQTWHQFRYIHSALLSDPAYRSRSRRSNSEIRIPIGRRCEQHARHEAEDRRGDADAECKGQNRDSGERRPLDEDPNGKTDII
jgi:hypothetical protein